MTFIRLVKVYYFKTVNKNVPPWILTRSLVVTPTLAACSLSLLFIGTSSIWFRGRPVWACSPQGIPSSVQYHMHSQEPALCSEHESVMLHDLYFHNSCRIIPPNRCWLHQSLTPLRKMQTSAVTSKPERVFFSK